MNGDLEKVKGPVEVHQPDLVLLDLLLPGKDGIELMQTIPVLSDRPAIFLSAYGRDETIAKALEIGAADYVVKPFSPTELIARIRAALRRNAGQPEPFKVGELAIDYDEIRVALEGRQLKLTATEYDRLKVLTNLAWAIEWPNSMKYLSLEISPSLSLSIFSCVEFDELMTVPMTEDDCYSSSRYYP